MRTPAPTASASASASTTSADPAAERPAVTESDLQIAGDILAVQHLLQPAREHPTTVAEFAGLARSIAEDRASWQHLVRYDATTRWYHRLRTVPQALGSARAGGAPIGYEVWLLSWVPGQGSGRHDHGASSGVLTVLDGALTEHSTRGALTLRAGAQRVFAPGYAHEVVNDSLDGAVSLHVYFPGLTEMPMHNCSPAQPEALSV
ncbi:cysteine dioxygenase family protein [Streptomyces sp. BR123]|uniref:cysteine dioxygenase n=1 Tax=Streptomyces sp. BR123 TaxID=2749828 RepID=UPI0015C4D348|nr:cysteine dioxygenase family protein [Streptomyces sp. BR123]NXY96352.1 cysteine dioxygenase family protein [Streptomyces sp. BR123]